MLHSADFGPLIAHLLSVRAVSFDDGAAALEIDVDERNANPCARFKAVWCPISGTWVQNAGVRYRIDGNKVTIMR